MNLSLEFINAPWIDGLVLRLEMQHVILEWGRMSGELQPQVQVNASSESARGWGFQIVLMTALYLPKCHEPEVHWQHAVTEPGTRAAKWSAAFKCDTCPCILVSMQAKESWNNTLNSTKKTNGIFVVFFWIKDVLSIITITAINCWCWNLRQPSGHHESSCSSGTVPQEHEVPDNTQPHWQHPQLLHWGKCKFSPPSTFV